MMTAVDVAHWKGSLQRRPLRDLVAYHLSRQDESTRIAAIQGTVAMLPERLRAPILEFAGILTLAANAPPFWNIDCIAFYELIAREVAQRCSQAALAMDDEMCINAFHVVLGQLAQSVHVEPSFRKSSGIRRSFPWLSTVSLAYPLLAYWEARSYSRQPMEAIGSGVTNLGYLLVVAGVFAGSFKAFRLSSRARVFIAAAIAWVLGVYLTNRHW